MTATPFEKSKPSPNCQRNNVIPKPSHTIFCSIYPINNGNDPQSFALSSRTPFTSVHVGCLTRSNICSIISWGVVTCQLARVLLLPWPTAVVNIASCWIFRFTGWASWLSMSVTDSGASNRRREDLCSGCCCCCPDWLNRRSARNMSSSVFKLIIGHRGVLWQNDRY